MGDIADQRLVLTLTGKLFLCVILQPLPHLLEIAAELPDLVIRLYIHRKIQITVLNVLRRHLQLLDRIDKTRINPYRQHACRQD